MDCRGINWIVEKLNNCGLHMNKLKNSLYLHKEITTMKKAFAILSVCVALAFTACTSNQHTQAGDSTGTGSAGARTPGNVTADTTRYDSTSNSPKKAIHSDSAKIKSDTVKK